MLIRIDLLWNKNSEERLCNLSTVDIYIKQIKKYFTLILNSNSRICEVFSRKMCVYKTSDKIVQQNYQEEKLRKLILYLISSASFNPNT